MNNEIDQVYPQLWIANISGARNGHPEQGVGYFDAVVTVCQDSIEDHIPEDVEYHFFEMADGPHSADAWGGRHDYEYFEYAARTILAHLENGDEVLVHCHAGQSRSASTSIAALGAYHEVSYFDMYDDVKSQRPQIHPDGLLESHAQRFIEERTGINHAPFQQSEVDE